MTKKKKKPKVTTQVKETRKPHEKFTQITKFHSTPVTLITEAETTKTIIKDLTPNRVRRKERLRVLFRNLKGRGPKDDVELERFEKEKGLNDKWV